MLLALLAGAEVRLGTGAAGALRASDSPASEGDLSEPRLSEPRALPPDEKPYALIFGTVWSPDDHPVYGVKVKIRREDQKKAKWELYSDHNGEFAQRVPAGKAKYIVWVEARDLKAIKFPDGKKLEPGPEVTVEITGDERQDIGLHLK